MKNKQFQILLGITITAFSLSAWAVDGVIQGGTPDSSSQAKVPADVGGNLTLVPPSQVPAPQASAPTGPVQPPSWYKTPDSTVVQRPVIQGLPSGQLPPDLPPIMMPGDIPPDQIAPGPMAPGSQSGTMAPGSQTGQMPSSGR